MKSSKTSPPSSRFLKTIHFSNLYVFFWQGVRSRREKVFPQHPVLRPRSWRWQYLRGSRGWFLCEGRRHRGWFIVSFSRRIKRILAGEIFFSSFAVHWISCEIWRFGRIVWEQKKMSSLLGARPAVQLLLFSLYLWGCENAFGWKEKEAIINIQICDSHEGAEFFFSIMICGQEVNEDRWWVWLKNEMELIQSNEKKWMSGCYVLKKQNILTK